MYDVIASKKYFAVVDLDYLSDGEWNVYDSLSTAQSYAAESDSLVVVEMLPSRAGVVSRQHKVKWSKLVKPKKKKVSKSKRLYL